MMSRLHDEYEPDPYAVPEEPEASPFPDLGVPLILDGDRAINAGAARAYLAGKIFPDGESMTDEQVERELGFDALDRMMREVYVPPGSRGSGGGGRTRKSVPPRATRTEVQEGHETVGVGHAPRYQIVGLTAGEDDFYERRPGRALEVLRRYAAAIADGHTPEEGPVGAGLRMRYNFSVYGLAEYEIHILLLYPGSARRELARHARETSKDHVEAIDRGAVEGK